MRAPRRPEPLDPTRLERLALRYVERFATTRAKLTRYLARKLVERGWAGAVPVDPGALADRLAALGYVDDAGFAAARSGAMARRGLGQRRIAQALRHDGIAAEEVATLSPDDAAAWASALAYARRRRIGPFAAAPADRAARERAIGQLVRAGHAFELAKRVVDTPADADLFDLDTLRHG